jgi:hypothetical protein
MYHSHKLKPDLSIKGLIPAIICLVTGFLAYVFYGLRGFFIEITLFFALYSLVSFSFFILTRNISYASAGIWQLLFALYVATRPLINIVHLVNTELRLLITFCTIASTVWLLYLVIRRKAKWKGREVFELASYETGIIPDGFTSRPRPAGKIEYSRDQLEGFADFMRRNLIAMPVSEENMVVFVPVKSGDEFMFLLSSPTFKNKRIWIAFDFSGNVTVNISRRDYLDYKEELSFDQLCENPGKLFAEFMEYYKKGEADRIVYKLDELQLGLAS